jgi:selenide,water dikinase
MVDDPFLYGQIAAANAISDVYAMGGRPLTAMNLCNFPGRGIDNSSLRRILEGALSKVREAGATVVGGHTVRDDELKFGLSVTGIIDPKRVLTNTGARPGDHLVLTKPIGTGVIINGHRRGMTSEETLEMAARSMATLNRDACETMLELDPHACTDVTGFGLSGHAMGIALGSDLLLRIRFKGVPRFEESLHLIGRGVTTVLTAANLQATRGQLTFAGALSEDERQIVADPQTSGGLLVAMPAEQAPKLVSRLRQRGNEVAAVIGEVVPAAGKPGLEILA